MWTGKILADEQTVEFYKIQEKDFVVCMVKKVPSIDQVFCANYFLSLV